MGDFTYKFNIDNIRVTAMLETSSFLMKTRHAEENGPEQIMSVHQHTNYELFFITDGSMQIYCGNRIYDCENTAVIVPPMIYHHTVPKNLNGYCLYFSVEPRGNPDERLYARILPMISKEPILFPLLENACFYATEIGRLCELPDRDEDIQRLLALILSSVFQSMMPEEASPSGKPNKHELHIKRIEIYITRHYCEKVRLSDIANELYLCPKQVSRIIRREYGCSLSELLNQRRLTVAAGLLRSTNLAVGEIAASIGYDQENYFYTLFRNAYGMPPLAYRAESQKQKTEVL